VRQQQFFLVDDEHGADDEQHPGDNDADDDADDDEGGDEGGGERAA